MASATWTPVISASPSSWSKNKALTDLQAAAPLYNDATITYNSPIVFYDGYDPSLATPEGERGATWTRIAE
jgi:hypothetical protein